MTYYVLESDSFFVHYAFHQRQMNVELCECSIF